MQRRYTKDKSRPMTEAEIRQYKAAEQRKSRLRKKLRVLAHYGGKCCCCGEHRYEFLAIDHINGGGLKERQKLGLKAGTTFYTWLEKNNYPAGYRVLCHNCNSALGYFGYCPHDSQVVPS